MTASARRRLGLRKSWGLWLTPTGEACVCGIVLAILIVAAWVLGAAFGGTP